MALNINGTTGISGVDGSASAPVLTGTDSNTGINFGTDIVNINTGGSTRATVDSSGNLGVGETTPLGKLHVKSSDSGASVATYADELVVEGSVDSGITILSGNTKDGSLAFGDDGNNVAGRVAYSHPIDSMQFFTAATERMRINSAGRFLIGTTTIADSSSAQMAIKGVHPVTPIEIQQDTAQNHFAITFRNSNGLVGACRCNGSSTFFDTSSDYRLKENAVAISNGITRLKTLKPYRFNFKADSSTTFDGFFAHEVSATVPEAINGTKDEVDKDNKPVYQSIDQSKLVPLLTAALQEAVAKIEVLETKVAALEAA